MRKETRIIISFILVLTMFFTTVPIQAEETDSATTLKLANQQITAMVGSSFDVSLSIENNPGIMGLDIIVEYDKNYVEPVEVSAGSVFKDETLNDSIDTSTTNSFHIMWAGSDNITTDGELFTVTFHLKKHLEIGTTNISFRANSEDTYNESYENVTIGAATLNVKTTTDVIIKQQPNLTVYMKDWTVGETASTPVLTGNTEGGAVTYEYSSSPDGVYSTEVPTQIGKYYLKATVAETNNYQSGVTTCSFKILEKSTPAPTKDAEVTPTDSGNSAKTKLQPSLAVYIEDWTAGETASTPVLIGNTEGGAVTYEYSVSPDGLYSTEIPTQIGTYYLRATVAETNNYQSGITTCSFKILENLTPLPTKDAEVTPTDSGNSVKTKLQPSLAVYMEDWTVGGTASTPVLVGNTEGGAVTYEYSASPDGVYSKEIPTQIGKYYLRATVAETNNYQSAITTCSFRILEKSAPAPTKDTGVTSTDSDNSVKSKISVNLKRKKYTAKYKVIVKSTAKLKRIKINNKVIKDAKDRNTYTFKLSRFKNKLRKKKWNTIEIWDVNDKKVTRKFKVKVK